MHLLRSNDYLNVRNLVQASRGFPFCSDCGRAGVNQQLHRSTYAWFRIEQNDDGIAVSLDLATSDGSGFSIRALNG